MVVFSWAILVKEGTCVAQRLAFMWSILNGSCITAALIAFGSGSVGFFRQRERQRNEG